MDSPKDNFSKIYDQYIDKIYRFVYLRVNSEEIAEDLTSESFLRCWEKFKTNQDKIENIQAFLYQIARNLIVDHYRERGRAQIISADSVPIIDPRNKIEEISQLKSDMKTIKAALANLNNDYQEMVIWHYVDDLSASEIAKITGKSEGAIRVSLHRALKALKSQLSDTSES